MRDTKSVTTTTRFLVTRRRNKSPFSPVQLIRIRFDAKLRVPQNIIPVFTRVKLLDQPQIALEILRVGEIGQRVGRDLEGVLTVTEGGVVTLDQATVFFEGFATAFFAKLHLESAIEDGLRNKLNNLHGVLV